MLCLGVVVDRTFVDFCGAHIVEEMRGECGTRLGVGVTRKRIHRRNCRRRLDWAENVLEDAERQMLPNGRLLKVLKRGFISKWFEGFQLFRGVGILERYAGVFSYGIAQTYVLQVLVVETMLFTEIIVFVAEHAAANGAIADTIANQVFRNAQQRVVSENSRKPSEKFADPHSLLFSPKFQTRVLAFISARVIPRHHRDA